MRSRREVLAGASTVGMLSFAGCLTANSDVADNYSRGYELYNTAEDAKIDATSIEGLEEVASLYERSAGYFESARQAAEEETVEEYCYEAHELATLDAESAKAEAEAKAAAEKKEESDDDEDRYETVDTSEYSAYLEKTRNEQLKLEYEMRSPSTVKRRSRIPF